MFLLLPRRRESGLTAGSGFCPYEEFLDISLYYSLIIIELIDLESRLLGFFGCRPGEDSTISVEGRRALIASNDPIEGRFDPGFIQSCRQERE
jgi:hypothetical protein